MDDEAVLARLGTAATAWRVPSVAAALVRDGELAWTGGVGHLDGRDGPRPTDATQYRIGSITKSLTAALVWLANDAGRLALDDRVGDHLDVGAVLGRVRVVDLLAHVGGVRAETSASWWERSPGRTWEALLDDLADDVAVPAPPGVLHYSNPGYAVLARVLEEVEDRSWEDLLQDRLLGPLGLARTSVHARDDDHALPLAVHPERGDLLVEPAHDYRAMAPAGQLWSSARDLGRWGEVLLGGGGDVLSPAIVEEMARPRAVATMDPPSAFGAGLQVLHLRGRDLVGHGGSVPGFVATVVVDRDTGAGVAVMGNSTTGFGPDVALDLLDLVDAGGRPGVGPDAPPGARPDRAVAATGRDTGIAEATSEDTDVEVAAAAAPVGTGEPADHDLDERTARPSGDARDLVGTWFWGPRPVVVTIDDDGAPVVDMGLPTRHSRFGRRDGTWVGRDGYFTGEVLAVIRQTDGTVSHLELASMALTPGPYDPPEAVPGGIGDGWTPRDG